MSIYYLSDKAYSGLCQLAIDYGYMHSNSRVKQGLAKLITLIVLTENFKDNRPPEILTFTLKGHQVWMDFDVRKQRRIAISLLVQQSLLDISIKYDITFQNKFTYNSRISATLEAIGLGYLVPSSLKYNANIPKWWNTSRHRYETADKKDEFDW
jgi:hypothetical protein